MKMGVGGPTSQVVLPGASCRPYLLAIWHSVYFRGRGLGQEEAALRAAGLEPAAHGVFVAKVLLSELCFEVFFLA